MNMNYIDELVTAISEGYNLKQLANEDFMKKKLRFFLKITDAEIEIILPAAREIRALRGDILPIWAQGLQDN